MHGHVSRLLKMKQKDSICWQQLGRGIIPCLNCYSTNINSQQVHTTGLVCHGMGSIVSSSTSPFSQSLRSTIPTDQIRSMPSHSYSTNENGANKELSPHLLRLVTETDPILHTPIQDMSLADISSNETKQIVANMIYSIRPEQLQTANAPYNKAAGMAANQWNIKKRIFLFCPDGSDGEVKVIFNPTYKPITLTQTSTNESKSTTMDPSTNVSRESCFSVPYAYGMVERYTHIEVSYVDDQGVEHRNEQLSGWQAKVWQHETDHLNGILYSNRQSELSNGPNCTQLHRFQTKTEFETHCTKEQKTVS